jgi:signal transduction histidine kinase
MQPNNLSIYMPDLESALDPNPVIVDPDTPVAAVIALMSQVRGNRCTLPTSQQSSDSSFTNEEQTSCVLVVEKSKLVGIFTERDLVRLTTSMTSLRGVKVSQVMTHSLITLVKSPSQNLFAAVSLFRKHHIRHLPIVDDKGHLIGLITPESLRESLQPFNLLKWRRVEDIMSNQVICALPTASVLHLAQLMTKYQVSCIVITAEGSQQLRQDSEALLATQQPAALATSNPVYPIGIITERDIVQFQTLELDLSQIEAQTVISTPLFCVSPSDLLLIAHQEMQQRRIRRLVVTGDEGELRGIVTQTDLLRVFDPVEMYGVVEVLNQSVDKCTNELKIANKELRHEIIERQKVEEQLRASELQLRASLEKQQELNELKSRFVAMASHDLRSPLTTILSVTDLLESHSHQLSEEKKQSYLQLSRDAVKHMTQLLNDILVIGEAEAGKLEFQPAPLDLVSFCDELVEELQLSTNGKCSLNFVSQGSFPNVWMDEKLLRQIFINILSNAIKYSPENSTVNFELTCLKNKAIFHVRDRGIGIPSVYQQRLFEPFHRGSNVGSISGTGLGLAIVKRCVESHGGTIEVISKVKVGTTIIVTLPMYSYEENRLDSDSEAISVT